MKSNGKVKRRDDVVSERYYRGSVLATLERQVSSSIVVIFSTRGMGRALIINDFIVSALRKKKFVESVDLTQCGDVPISVVLDSMIARCIRHDSRRGSVLVVKDLHPLEDEELEQVIAMLLRARELDVAVVVGTVPENEVLLDGIDDVYAFWPCDLCLDVRPHEADPESLQYLTHGIPSLVREYDKLQGLVYERPFTSASYLEAFASCVRDCQRSGLTREERVAVALMLLIGSGRRADVERLVGALDDAIWNSLARCEPFLGVEVGGSAFAVVGCDSHGSVEATVAALAGSTGLWGPHVPDIVALLVERGAYARAATVSVACTDTYTRCKLALTNYVPFVNAGAVGIVRDACEAVEAEGYYGVPGYQESRSALSSLLYVGRYEGPVQRKKFYGSTARGRYAEVCLAVREGLRGEYLDEVLVERLGDDAATRVLLAHARVICLIMQGSLIPAHLQSIDSDVIAGTGTLLGALLRLDSAFCSVMSGMPLAREECRTLAAGRDMLEHAGLGQLVKNQDALILLARTLGGRACDYAEFSTLAQRARDRGDTVLGALFMLGAGVHDLRIKSRIHGRVRIANACSGFASAGATWWYACARLLELAVTAEEGGRVGEAELRACLGHASEIDALVTLLSCALGVDDVSSLQAHETLEYVDANVLWVINVLSHDLPKVSEQVCSCLSEPWLKVMRDVELAAITEEGWTGPYASLNRTSAFDDFVGLRPVTIRALGGLDVRVCGRDVPADWFGRRKGLALLALLVASEDHVVSRKDVMASFDLNGSKDNDAMLKSVGAAAAVVRSVIKCAGGDESLGEALVANKTRSRISLTDELVACDVDLFVECARLVKVEEKRDKVVAVRACRDAEELYCGDLFAPEEDDCMQLCKSRRTALHDLFVSTMLSGSRAADELGRHAIAARFAERGYEMAPENEDLLAELVKALFKSGQRLEARRRYLVYVDKVVRNCQFVSDDLRKRVGPYVGEDNRIEREALGRRLPGHSITILEGRGDVEGYLVPLAAAAGDA